MRILTRKLWRAFPELDRFEDEQCRRFVRAAAGSRRRRLGRFAVALLTSVAWLAGVLALAIATRPKTVSHPGGIPLWPIFLCALAPLLGFVARDILLRLRVRWVLRNRGCCRKCRYSLIGVRVANGLDVTCPECGSITQIDPSLNELARGTSGEQYFNPDASHPVPPLLSPRAAKVLIRAAIALVAALLLLAGGYEAFLRRQAASAAATRPGASAASALVLSGQPRDADNSPLNNAWSALLDTIAQRISIENAAIQATALRTANGDRPYPDYTSIYIDPRPDESPESAEQTRLARELALEILPQLRAAGVFETMRQIASRTHAVRPLQCPPNQPLFMVVLNELGYCRALGRINFARMHLADAAGDPSECVDAFESALAIARVVRHQCFAVDWMVASGIEAEALRHARAVLVRHPDWHAPFDDAFRRQRTDIGVAHALAGERIAAVDLICWAFADPANIRFGRRSKPLANVLSVLDDEQLAKFRLGTLASNLEEAQAFYDGWDRYASLAPWLREEASPPEPARVRHTLLLATIGTGNRFVASADAITASRAAFSLMVAIERYKATRNQYPQTLDELVPDFIASLPPDPFTGSTPRYRRIDPTTDPAGRAYLAYFVGPDKTDDLGTAAADTVWWQDQFITPRFPRNTNTDLLFNDPR